MNKYRAEVEVTLGGKTLKLRPSFDAMAELEAKTKLSTAEIMQALSEKRVSYPIIAAAFWAGHRATLTEETVHRALTYSEVGSLVQAAGLQKVMPPFVQFLINALSSDDELQRRAEDAAGKAETPPTP